MKNKKILSLISVFLVILTLNSCTKERFIERDELSLRLAQENEAYIIHAESIIFDNDRQYIFYSLTKPDDCLLSLKTDKSSRIEAFSLTLDKDKWNNQEFQDSFLPFFDTLTKAFCGFEPEKVDEVKENLRIADMETYADNHFEETENSGYGFTLYVNEISVVLRCVYTIMSSEK